jgi:hypothetical protein
MKYAVTMEGCDESLSRQLYAHRQIHRTVSKTVGRGISTSPAGIETGKIIFRLQDFAIKSV